MIPCDLATGEKADQRHVAQGVPHHLQLGVPRAKVRPPTSRATDIYRARHAPCCSALQFGADFRRDAHQIELCGFCVARAKSQAHAGLDVLGDRQNLVLPVHAHQVPHDGIRAELSGPNGTSSAAVNQAHQRTGQRLRQLMIRQVPIEPEILQHAIERGLVVQADHEIALGVRDVAPRSDRLAALSYTRDQADFRAKATPDKPPVNTPSAICTVRLRADDSPPNR